MLLNGKDFRDSSQIKEKNQSDTSFKNREPSEKLNWLIHLQYVRGELASCKYVLANELRNKPKNVYALFYQALVNKEEGNIQTALEKFYLCLKLCPTNEVILNEAAKCLYTKQRFELALKYYLKSETLLKNEDWQLYDNIALCYLKLKKLQEAKSYAERSVKVGNQKESYCLLVKILMYLHNLHSALDIANTGIGFCIDNVELLVKSGLLYLRLNELHLAFERFSQALAMDQKCSSALLGVGYITQVHNKYNVAITKYKTAVSYDSESPALWNNMGNCFTSKQKYFSANSCLKRALWISPLNWKIHFNVGLMNVVTKQHASGFNFACSSINLSTSDGDCYSLLGVCLFRFGDIKNALLAVRQAAKLSPDETIFMVNSILLMEKNGLYGEAEELTSRLKELLSQEIPNNNPKVLSITDNLVKIQLSRSQ